MKPNRNLESRLDIAFKALTTELKAAGQRGRGLRAQGLAAMRPEQAATLSHILLTAIKRDGKSSGNRTDELHLEIGAVLALSGPTIPREDELWRRLEASVESAKPYQRTSGIAGLSLVYQAGSPERRQRAGDLLARIPVSRMDAFEWLDLMEDAGMYLYPEWCAGVARTSLENPFMAEIAVQHLDAEGVLPILQALTTQGDESLVTAALLRLSRRTVPISVPASIWLPFLTHRSSAVRLAAVTASASGYDEGESITPSTR